MQVFNCKSEIESLEHNKEIDVTCDFQTDLSQFYSCQIDNLLDWLKLSRLHKYHSLIKNLSFGEFYALTEDTLNNLGFVDGAAKKLISLIRNLKLTDICVVSHNVINFVSRNRSNSNDSSRSISESCSDISNSKSSDPFNEANGVKLAANAHSSNLVGVYHPFLCHQPFMPMPSLIMLSPNVMPGPHMFSFAQSKPQINPPNTESW